MHYEEPKGLRTHRETKTFIPMVVEVPAVLPSLWTHCQAPVKHPVLPGAQLAQMWGM